MRRTILVVAVSVLAFGAALEQTAKARPREPMVGDRVVLRSDEAKGGLPLFAASTDASFRVFIQYGLVDDQRKIRAALMEGQEYLDAIASGSPAVPEREARGVVVSLEGAIPATVLSLEHYEAKDRDGKTYNIREARVRMLGGPLKGKEVFTLGTFFGAR